LGVDHGLIAHDWLVKQVSNSVAFRGGVSVFVALASISFLTELLIQGMQHFHRNSEARSPLARDALPWSLCAVSTEILPGIPEIQQHVVKLQQGKATSISGVSNDFLHSVMQVPSGGGSVATECSRFALFFGECSV
jgi:hypothetical protein